MIVENSPRIFLISFIFVVIITVVSWISMRLPGNINVSDIYSRLASGELPGYRIIYTNFRPLGVILALFLLLLQPVFDVGFISYCLKILRRQKTEIKDILNGFLFFSKVIFLFITTTIMIFLWSLLFIIPGIIASYRYRQVYYILLDDPKKGVLQCITESKFLMNGRKVDLFIIDFSFIGWYILDLVIATLSPLPFALPIVSVWLSPYMGLTRAAFYEYQIANMAV